MTLPILITIPVPEWYTEIMSFLTFLNFNFFSYQLFIDDPLCLGSCAPATAPCTPPSSIAEGAVPSARV